MNYLAAEGNTLPDRVHPTSSARPRQPVQQRPQSKVINARQVLTNYNLHLNERVCKRLKFNEFILIFSRNYTPQIRSRDQIESDPEIYEREQFKPTPLTKYGEPFQTVIH